MSSPPTGTYTGVGATIGSVVPGVGTAIGAAIGGVLDVFSSLGVFRGATQLIPFSDANRIATQIADKTTEYLKRTLTDAQFQQLADRIEDSAISLLNELERNASRRDPVVREINASRSMPDAYTNIQFTIYRIMLHRAQYWASADPISALQADLTMRIEKLISLSGLTSAKPDTFKLDPSSGDVLPKSAVNYVGIAGLALAGGLLFSLRGK